MLCIILTFLHLSLSWHHKLFFFLYFSRQHRFITLTFLFFVDLSVSLFLLNLNPYRLWDVGFIWFFFFFLWVCLGFIWLFVGFVGVLFICLYVLFHSIFNDLFWVCLYFLFLLSFCGFVMQIMCLMKCFYELCLNSYLLAHCDYSTGDCHSQSSSCV